MEKNVKFIENIVDDDLGLILQRMETIEKFFPCYQSMIKRWED